MTLDEASKIRGGVYISAKARGPYSMWRDYDRGIIERDLGFAAKLRLNALRVFLSYEYWLEDRGRLENSLYHLLHSAWNLKIRIVPVLFGRRGVDGGDEEASAWARSPARALVDDAGTWVGIEDYVNWFMQRWSHEHRVLALEIIDEPRTVNEFKFARQMLLRASRHRKSLPLTFGARRLEDSRFFQDLPLDILQVHAADGGGEEELRGRLEMAMETQEILQRPVILGEWGPVSAGMARIVRGYPLGNFFWSLMVRAADFEGEMKGGSRGLFHENGAVSSLADARAISGDGEFSAEERH
jgi:hypothetical protein